MPARSGSDSDAQPNSIATDAAHNDLRNMNQQEQFAAFGASAHNASRVKTLSGNSQSAYVAFAMSDTLVVNEIYLSLQGESTFAGLPCIFVRLTACNLRCSYCDTAYAFTEGKKTSVSEILDEIHGLSKAYENQNADSVFQKLP